MSDTAQSHARAATAKTLPESSKKKTLSLSSVRHAFVTIVWPRRKLVFIGLLLITVNRLAGLVLPGSTKFLIDKVVGEGNTDLLKLLLVVVGSALFVQSVTSFLLTRLLSVEAQHLISVLRTQMQKHIVRLPLAFFDNNKSGSLVTRIMNDVEGVRNLIGTGLVQLVGGVLTAVVALVLLIQINARMTLFTFLPLVVFGLISMKAFSYIRPIFRRRGEINAEVTGRLTETLGGIRVIKGVSRGTAGIRGFRARRRSRFSKRKRVADGNESYHEPCNASHGTHECDHYGHRRYDDHKRPDDGR